MSRLDLQILVKELVKSKTDSEAQSLLERIYATHSYDGSWPKGVHVSKPKIFNYYDTYYYVSNLRFGMYSDSVVLLGADDHNAVIASCPPFYNTCMIEACVLYEELPPCDSFETLAKVLLFLQIFQ